MSAKPVYTANSAKNALATDTPKPLGCTNLQLRQLMRRVAQHYDQEVGKTGLKGTQYSLLSYVAKLGPSRPGELARAMKIDPSTLTRNLKPLIANGWVVLEPGADGRSRTISVTQSGRSKRAEAQRHWKVAQDGINQALGPARVVSLHAMINESLELLQPIRNGTDNDHD
jgi:DNA-binding MarR family transcriptional regulator